ncbi:hypothetical protein [Pulveribacter sp.]|uniref:hypothetical protein n=1 Tax=Pulveribacter sp. TaxID=2678893 RepID=UPI0028A9E1CF|nr:hypothetical protein [Pulveribacter sp.]
MEQALAIHPAWVGIAGMGCVLFFHLLGWALSQVWWRGSARHVSEPAASPLLALFFQQALGMGAAMVGLLCLAVFGVFSVRGIAGAASGVVLTIGAARARQAGRGGAGQVREWSLAKLRPWEALVLACAVALAAAQSWHFPSAWDDTAYHLPLARAIVDHQALVADEWLRFPYFPAFMQLLFAAGLLLDVSLAQWLATWPVVVTLLGLMGATRWLCGHAAWGVMAWALYVYSPASRHSLGAAYVDAGLALFGLAAILAAAMWSQASPVMVGRRSWLVIAGLCAGVAGGIKFHGLVIAAALGLAVAWQSVRRAGLQQALVDICVYAGVSLGACGFWYLRSYWLTGDPIHPAGGAWFGYYLWTQQDMDLQLAEQASHGVPRHWSNFLVALWQVHAPYLCLALMWPVLLLRRHAHAWGVVGLVFYLGLAFWFWVSQVDRYLLTVLPAGALLCIGVVQHALACGMSGVVGGAARKAGRSGLAFLAVVLGLSLAWASTSALLSRPSIADQRDAHDEIVLLHEAEALAQRYGDKVLNLGYENAFFYYRGQLVGDWFGPAAFPRIADCSQTCRMRSVGETSDIMRRLGVHLLLIHAEKFPFDLQQYAAGMVLVGHRGSAFLFALP